jgi:serine-type D-Ala-D-Ala endopeptidase (penicillin-binding protein 7)
MFTFPSFKPRLPVWVRSLCVMATLTAAAIAADASTRPVPLAKTSTASKAQKAVASKSAITTKSRAVATRTTASASRTSSRASTGGRTTRGVVAARAGSRSTRGVSLVRRAEVRVPAEPLRQSFGQIYGLHDAADPLELKSGVAFVVDQDTNEVLLNKNSSAVLPIASITKLMTALVVTEANLSLDDVLTISQEDVDTEKGSSSRLQVGTQLTRGEMLHLALMSSENRAASALGRHYPGGFSAFVSAMNAKAKLLGMHDTRYVEPTGLSSRNQSSALDLATLVKAAYRYPLIRELSTSPEYQVFDGQRQLQYHTTNRLVLNPSWDIGLQKTGYISEAGQCLVMQAQMAGRKLIMVLLDSAGKYSRIGDAERIRQWLLTAESAVGRGTAAGVRASPLAAPVLSPQAH